MKEVMQDEFADFPTFEDEELIQEALKETADEWKERRFVKMDKALHDIDETVNDTLLVLGAFKQLIGTTANGRSKAERTAAQAEVANLAILAKERLEWISQRINEGLTVKE